MYAYRYFFFFLFICLPFPSFSGYFLYMLRECMYSMNNRRQWLDRIAFDDVLLPFSCNFLFLIFSLSLSRRGRSLLLP